jgi:hypothetical protein
MSKESLIKTFLDIFINPTFRWVILFITIILTIIAYLQEPIRYSYRKAFTGLKFNGYYFILICITLFIYIFNLLSLEYSIPLSKNMPYLWYLPLIIILYSIVTDIYMNSELVSDENGNLEPPPSYMLPKNYRLLIFYFILIFDIIIFAQTFIYSGISIQFKTTILHQFILNRFGGISPSNIMMFIISWAGVIGIGLDIYMIRNQTLFNACNYSLPESWNF